MTSDFWDYWTDFWNYFDFIPPVLIFVLIYYDQLQFTSGNKDEHELPIQVGVKAVATLMIWLKFLYYLRIFEATSSLIRMITQVVVDIRYFLMVLLLTIVAFGDAFKTISNGNDSDGFVQSGFFGSFFYVYNMCLGAYENDYGSV